MSGRITLAALIAVAAVTLGSTAHADDAAAAAAAPTARGRAFSLKLAGGPGIRGLYGHRMLSGEIEAAVGGQSTKLGALHGVFALGFGDTEEDLGLMLGSAGISWERPIGRLRPGLMANFYYLAIDRFTRDESIETGAITAGLFGTVDLVSSEHAALFVGLRGEAGLGGEATLFGGGAARVGTRFLAF